MQLGINERSYMKLTFVLVLALVTTVQHPSSSQAIPDPHHHVNPVHEELWSVELTPGTKVTLLKSHIVSETDSVVSPGGRWKAFVFFPKEENGGRLAVEEVRSRKQYQLVGLPLEWRPLSGLVWLDANRLAFDRWSTPHYGIHYVLDMSKLRLILAAPAWDEFYQQQSRDTTR